MRVYYGVDVKLILNSNNNNRYNNKVTKMILDIILYINIIRDWNY
jgi:hypothetical protein